MHDVFSFEKSEYKYYEVLQKIKIMRKYQIVKLCFHVELLHVLLTLTFKIKQSSIEH